MKRERPGQTRPLQTGMVSLLSDPLRCRFRHQFAIEAAVEVVLAFGEQLVVLAGEEVVGAGKGLLEPVQHHDLDQLAGMQRRRRRIEADIVRHPLLRKKVIKPGFIGNLMNETALRKRVQEFGFERRHGAIFDCWIKVTRALARFFGHVQLF